MSKIDNTSKPKLDMGDWIGITLGITAIAVVFWTSAEARSTFSTAIHSSWPMRLFYGVLVAGMVVAIIRTWQLGRLRRANILLQGDQQRLEGANETLKADKQTLAAENDFLKGEKQKLETELASRNIKEPDRRWEKLVQISYGHIEYDPFLGYQDGKATGLGFDILKDLLVDRQGPSVPAIRLHPWTKNGDWKTIFDGLARHDYDVVATPLFATCERSKRVRFTSPLFFSNIGFYVRNEVAKLTGRNIKVENLRHKIQGVAELCPLRSPLGFLSIEGEISHSLADKYARSVHGEKHKSLTKTESPDTALPSLFPQVQLEIKPYRGLFCESFLAQRHDLVKSGKVVNILEAHSILYPVCFAVRMGDYHLMNLLNIRLLDYTKKRGALEELADRLAKKSGFTTDQVKEHFVAEWPCSVPLQAPKEAGHA